jgi:hypothetical protein
MRLPLSAANTALLLAVLDELSRHGGRPVLVGGLVPPLLVATLAPGALADLAPRTTNDCDVAFLTDASAASYDACRAAMLGMAFRPVHQFRWRHASGLLVDAMPVPTGVERGDASAVAFARAFLHDDPARFYRGYELALARPITAMIELDDGATRPVAIASITAMLAMKLQAFLDRPFDRQRDAQDVVWLARSLDPDVIGDDLVACRSARGDLVDEILARLEQHFADPWSRGISAYFEQAFRGRTSFDEDARREGGAAAIGALLAAYRRLA